MMTSWLAENGVQIIIGLLGAGTLVGIVRVVLSYFAHIQINRETAVARRNQTADETVANALKTLSVTVENLKSDNTRMRKRMSDMEAVRELEHEALRKERDNWQAQMAELREQLSAARDEIANRDKEIEALTTTITELTRTVSKLQTELTQAKRGGTGLNYTQRRKQ